jgi:hypothetical protein
MITNVATSQNWEKKEETKNNLAYTYLVSISQSSSSFVGHQHYIINIHPLVGNTKKV